jgi:tRNA-specific adenosine deaminase 3
LGAVRAFERRGGEGNADADADAADGWPGELAHVKRARKKTRGDGEEARTEVRVCVARGGGAGASAGDARAEVAGREALARALGDAGVGVGEGDGGREVFSYVDVPREAPTDKEALMCACALWPVTLMAPDPRLRAEVETPSETERAYMRAWTREACVGAYDVERESCGNCVVIVDPVSGVEIARGRDESRVHPLRHAALVAVECAAKRDLERFPEEEHVQALIEARRAEKIAAEVGGADEKKRKRDAQVKGATVTEIMGRPYLCTGYDAFMAREPCIMCAMALVHSRLKRVIFAAPDDKNGALTGPGGARRLHGVRSLNHHYSVYSFDVDAERLLGLSRSGGSTT